MSIIIQKIASALGHGNEYNVDRGMMTRCPGHTDKGTSLHIFLTESGQFRLSCHGGCRTKKIFEILRKKMLVPEKINNAAVPVPVSTLRWPIEQQATADFSKLEALNKISYTSTELLTKEYPPEKFYLEPFLFSGSLVMIHASPGTGKSIFIMFIALALTRKNGRGFTLGPLKVIDLCGVVILDGEMRPYQIQERTKIFIEAMGAEHPDYPLTFLTSDDLFVQYGERLDLGQREWRDAITKYMIANPVNKVLIIDNRTALVPYINENSSTSSADYDQWLLCLRSLDIAVIEVHHSNKSGAYSGHSKQIRPLDLVIYLKSQKGPENLCFEIIPEKVRGGQKSGQLRCVLEGVEDPENPNSLILTASKIKIPDEEEDQKTDNLIMAHAMMKKKSQAEIAEMFDVSQATVSNSKRQAIKKGYLTKDGVTTDTGKEFLRIIKGME